jgi:hypothetical protein
MMQENQENYVWYGWMYQEGSLWKWIRFYVPAGFPPHELIRAAQEIKKQQEGVLFRMFVVQKAGDHRLAENSLL